MIHRRKLLAGLGASIIVPKVAEAGMLLNPYRFAAGGAAPLTLSQMITNAGLTSGLVLCLDAADSASYNGTSQTWEDVSGNSNDFFRGPTASTTSDDPVFNGSAGGLSENEYFLFDGGAFFRHTVDHTYDHTWHRNNAAFTVVAALQLPTSSNVPMPIYANYGASDNEGVAIYKDGSVNDLKVAVLTASGGAAFAADTGNPSFPSDEWVFIAFAINEATGANGATLMINSTQTQFTSTYTTPGTSAPAGATTLGCDPNNNDDFPNGSRLACVAAWSNRVSNANLTTLYTAVKLRYSTMA